MTMRRAIVRLDGQRVGILSERASGSAFAYDEAWLARPDAEPISLTMPLRAEPYESRRYIRSSKTSCPRGGCSS